MDEFDRALDRHRNYLVMLANMQFDRRLRGRLDASDVVQETLQEAHLHREQFRGDNSVQLAAWLRQILRNNLFDAAKRHLRGKRAVDMEQSIGAMHRSSVRLEAVLAADQTSPSECAMRHEELIELASALEQLPPDQAEAVRLKHLLGWSLQEIADHMEKTTPAVAGLLHRGLKKLREIMERREAEMPVSDISEG